MLLFALRGLQCCTGRLASSRQQPKRCNTAQTGPSSCVQVIRKAAQACSAYTARLCLQVSCMQAWTSHRGAFILHPWP